MKKTIFTTLCIALINLSLFAQTKTVDVKALDKYFEQAQKDWNIPGFSIGIIKDGEVVLAKGYGVIEEGKKAKVDEKTLYAIASNTKAFLSAAVGILVDEGKLKWDDPVKKHLPYFELSDPFITEHTTVRDLLCHRVGLGSFSGDVMWYKSELSAEEVLKRAKEIPPAFDFRAGYGYSNLMFIAAGEVIHAVTGKTWAEFVEERIIAPLDMSRTQTSVVPLAKMTNVATPHKPQGDKNMPIPYINWDNMGAAGGIVSSVEDMLKWMDLQLQGGQIDGEQIFSERAQAEFWHPHNTRKVSAGSKKLLPSKHFSAYGLGWALFDYGGRMVTRHGGGYDGMYSGVTLVPEEKLGIVVLTNSMKGISTPLIYQTLDAYLGLEPRDWSAVGQGWEKDGKAAMQERIDERINRRMVGMSQSLELAEYSGLYRGKLNLDIEVKMVDSQLQLHFVNAKQLEATLEHWHHNTFKINWKETHAWFGFGTVQFILDNNGAVQELQFDVPNNDIFFEEIQAKKVKN